MDRGQSVVGDGIFPTFGDGWWWHFPQTSNFARLSDENLPYDVCLFVAPLDAPLFNWIIWQWGFERFQLEFLEPAILRIQGSQEELNGKMAVICHYVASWNTFEAFVCRQVETEALIPSPYLRWSVPGCWRISHGVCWRPAHLCEIRKCSLLMVCQCWAHLGLEDGVGDQSACQDDSLSKTFIIPWEL